MSKVKKHTGSRHALPYRPVLGRRMAAAIVFVFSFLLYVNTVQNDYSVSDSYVVEGQMMVEKGLAGITEILTTPYQLVDNKENTEYRPLAKLSFAIEHQFFGGNPHVSHFIQSVLYGLLCVTFLVLLLQIFPDARLLFPLSAALLFASHPIHAEVAASLKNREEIFSLLFSLLFLITFLKAWKRKSAVLWTTAAVIYLLAFVSKQSSLVLVLWTPLLLYFTDKKIKPLVLPAVSIVLLLIAIVFVWVVIHFILHLPVPANEIRTYAFEENPFATQKDYLLRIGTGLNGLGFYLQKLIYPHPLNWYYGYNMIPLQYPWELKPLFFLLVYAALTFFSVRGILKRSVSAFAGMMYLLAIAPYSNMVFLNPGIVSEREALFASSGFCIALALLLLRLSGTGYMNPAGKVKPFFFLLLVPVLFLYSVKTITRNRDWKNYLTLFSADMKRLDRSSLANQKYAYELYRVYKMGTQPQEGLLENCISHYRRSLEIYPGNVSSNSELARILYVEKGQYAESAALLLKVVRQKPENAPYHFELAVCYQQLKQNDSAALFYKKSFALDTSAADPLINLAVIYSDKGQQDSAIYFNQKALQLAPGSEVAIANMGFYYKKKGDFNLAKNYFENALSINPNRQDIKDALKEMGF